MFTSVELVGFYYVREEEFSSLNLFPEERVQEILRCGKATERVVLGVLTDVLTSASEALISE